MAADVNPLIEVYDQLQASYGEQAWWPAEDAFEVMVGAILTQNTSWKNVEKAIASLKQAKACNSDSLVAMTHADLAELIRSSGYYNQKAERLQLLSAWYLQLGGMAGLQNQPTGVLRQQLIALKGIGDETADAILLFALQRPVFVIDTYTRRIFSRLDLIDGAQAYHQIQQTFETELARDAAVYQQYHALIVEHAKRHCRKVPACDGCPVAAGCGYHEQQRQS